jgi:hypothetical protein
MATRMQQRRGTAAQWTAANPILSAGEIGFETDTGRFKIGDGTSNWSTISYFENLADLGGSLDDYIPLTQKGEALGVATLDENAAIPVGQLINIIASAPESLDTLKELADTITDVDGLVKTAINTAVSSAISTEVTDRNAAITTAVDSAIETEVTARTAAIADSTTSMEAYVAGVVSSAESGIRTDLGQDITDAISTAESFASLADTTVANNAASDATTKANTAQTNAESYTDTAVSAHSADTTSVHGIANTANLVLTDDSRLSDTRTPTDNTVSTEKIVDGAVTSAKIANGTIVDADINGSAAIATSKISGLDSALAAKAPLAAPALTGNATAENLTISGNLTVNGTTTTVSSANLELTDSLIYLSSTQYDTDAVDIGVYGAYGDSNPGHFHTGLVRDASDGKWKLISAGSEPTSNVIDFSGVTYDTVKLGGVEFSDGTQVKQGVPSLTAINQQTGAYTPVLTDRDKMIEISSASGVTVTIPTNASVAYPVGTSFDILQTGAGQITIAGAAGVTVNATPGLKLRTQWSSATLFKRATDTWVVYGDLSA